MKYFRYKIAAMMALLSLLLPAGLLTACSDDDPYFTATEDDAPRILNTDLVYDGSPLTLNGKATENFKYNVIVTPANYTTVTGSSTESRYMRVTALISKFLPVSMN